MDKHTFNVLLNKYLGGNASEAEKKLLERYYAQLEQQGGEENNNAAEDELLRQKMLQGILAAVQQEPAAVKPLLRRRSMLLRFRAAAAILLFIVTGFILLKPAKQGAKDSPIAKAVTPAAKIVTHGTDKAILTLGDGAAIVLDSAGNGTLQQQGSTNIVKKGAHLLYTAPDSGNQAVSYNTLSTPKGGQYHVTLSDGTEVWLNASSSIRFPAVFNGGDRNVEITGEAYFEVAKNPSKPFHVQANGITVEVLGTHFNVKAYSDEATVNTTLLEGAVKVRSGSTVGMLRPGQQAAFNTAQQSVEVQRADTEKAMAWMNGMLIFKRDDIKTIMRQISRWYDVEIKYSGEIPAKRYSGSISKYANIGEVLRILELGGIRFKTDGNSITVLR